MLVFFAYMEAYIRLSTNSCWKLHYPRKLLVLSCMDARNVKTRRNGGHKTDKIRACNRESYLRERYAHAAGLIIAIEIFTCNPVR